jgi:hypothetical protein
MYAPSPIMPQTMINHQMPPYQGQNISSSFGGNFHPQFGFNMHPQFHPQGYNFTQMQNNYSYPQQNYMNFQQPTQMYLNNNPHNMLMNPTLHVNNPNMISPTINSNINIHQSLNQKVTQTSSN